MNTPNEDRRSQKARQAILDAALELCREKGLGRASMEEIARRAGVGKQTIYRWWPSKAAVLQEAINEAAGAVTDFPDTGDLRTDLRTQMTGVARLLADPRFTPYTSLIGVAQDDPEAARAFLEGIVEPRVEECRKRLRRAQEQGQLRLDADLDDVVELLYAPLYYRALLRTRPVVPEQVDEILKLAFSGLVPDLDADTGPAPDPD